MIPAPTQITGTGSARHPPLAQQNSAPIRQDGADIGEVTPYAADQNGTLSWAQVNFGSSSTVTLLGSRLPFTLVVTLNDTSGGFPGTDTEQSYDMGPSADSVTLTPASADETYTAARLVRRF